MFKRLIAAALVFGMAALAPPAWARFACAARTDIANRLENQFNEKLSALGLRSAADFVEISKSDDLACGPSR